MVGAISDGEREPDTFVRARTTILGLRRVMAKWLGVLPTSEARRELLILARKRGVTAPAI